MKNTLNESATRVLEGAAFLFTEPLANDAIPKSIDEWQPMVANLWYEGPNKGFCELWLTTNMAKTIAQNMLGLDISAEIPEAKLQDAAKELLNMIVGNFLTDAFGAEDIYHLGIPELRIPTAMPIDQPGEPLQIWIDAEGEVVMLRLENHSL